MVHFICKGFLFLFSLLQKRWIHGRSCAIRHRLMAFHLDLKEPPLATDTTLWRPYITLLTGRKRAPQHTTLNLWASISGRCYTYFYQLKPPRHSGNIPSHPHTDTSTISKKLILIFDPSRNMKVIFLHINSWNKAR